MCIRDRDTAPESSDNSNDGSTCEKRDEGSKLNSNTNDESTSESEEKQIEDVLSVSTTSSNSSYDDAVFHSQFKKVLSYADSEVGETIGKKLETPKTWVISVEVEDTGSGIDAPLQESVFEPFVQGDQTLSRQYGGTGLGLSICRQLAHMMKGTMKLDSKVGVGSKFTFTVPLLQTREIVFDEDEAHFEDEFNANSKKNRKVKFKVNSSKRSVNMRKSKSSIDGSSDSNSCLLYTSRCV